MLLPNRIYDFCNYIAFYSYLFQKKVLAKNIFCWFIFIANKILNLYKLLCKHNSIIRFKVYLEVQGLIDPLIKKGFKN